jgi:hypothetical protein
VLREEGEGTVLRMRCVVGGEDRRW